MYVGLVPADFRGQKSSSPLELKLQMAVNHDVGAGNQTQILKKSRWWF